MTVGDALGACAAHAFASGFADLFASSVVLVVGGHVADAGVQPLLWGSHGRGGLRGPLIGGFRGLTCTTVWCTLLVGGCVELDHEGAVCGAGGVEFLGAFVEPKLEVDGVLLELGDALFELVDVDGVAETGDAPGLLA